MSAAISQFGRYVKSLFLLELFRGLGVTGRRLFSRKITVQYPEEKTPQSHRFRGLHALRLIVSRIRFSAMCREHIVVRL